MLKTWKLYIIFSKMQVVSENVFKTKFTNRVKTLGQSLVKFIISTMLQQSKKN